MKLTRLRTLILSLLVAACGLLLPISASAQDLEELYFKASEKAQQGDFEGALGHYNEIVENLAQFAWEDYGPVFGGIYYDKGICHLQLSQLAEATEAFRVCHEEFPNGTSEKRPTKSPIASQNMRWELALFQWGYCEQQAENFQAALDLYDKFLEVKPDPSILKPIHAAYVLRRGVCLIGIDKLDEGEKEIRRLFDEYETTFRGTSGQLLFQAMLDLANGWVKNAQTEGEKVDASANAFLDQYGGLFSISPYDKARLGFVERLRLIGYEAQQARLYEVSLRFFTMVPTNQAILADLRSRAAQTGGAARAAYDKVIEEYEAELQKPDPAEVDTLRLIAACYEGLGNRRAGYVLNRYLIEHYPNSENMPDLLHEASRYAFALGDGAAAQYFGEKFMADFPEHKLRDQVATYMLQALFRNQKYEICADVAGRVRDRFEAGAAQRELADYIYGAAMYFLDRQPEAREALDLHVENYPDSGNREAARFFQASNRIIMGEYQQAEPLLDSFLAEYQSSTFRDQMLFDRATCYYIASDYVSSIQRLQEIFENYPNSNVYDRAYLLKGDTVRVMSNTPEEGKELKDYLTDALTAFQAGKDAAERLDHKFFRAEGLFKIVDVSIELEEWQTAIDAYDAFFPDHVGTTWEPQISVFAMPALEKASRADDGLTQLEKMIAQLSEGEDTELLQQAIGSYQTSSIKNRSHDATIAKYDEMIAAGNVNLQTWLMIHKIMVYQDQKKGVAQDSPEAKGFDDKVAAVFKTLTDYAVTDLSDIALKAIGEYLEVDNPFRAKPFFAELLNRPNDTFKAPAEMALGRIEARSTDPAEVDNAVQRFKRVINVYSDPKYDAKNLLPEAHLQIARIAVLKQNWKEAQEYLAEYVKNKSWDAGRKERRAEAMYLYGLTFEKQGQEDDALTIYNSIFATYAGYPEWAATAVERGFDIGWNKVYAAEGDKTADEVTNDKRHQAYMYLRRVLYSWQQMPDGEFDALDRLRNRRGVIEAELGLNAGEIAEIERQLGIDKKPGG